MAVARFDAEPEFVVSAHAGEGLIASHRVRGKRAGSGINFIDLVVVPPGTSIGRHRHVGADEEIYVVIDGVGVMAIEGDDVAVGPGDVIVNPRGGSHGLVNRGPDTVRLVVIDVLDFAEPYREPVNLG